MVGCVSGSFITVAAVLVPDSLAVIDANVDCSSSVVCAIEAELSVPDAVAGNADDTPVDLVVAALPFDSATPVDMVAGDGTISDTDSVILLGVSCVVFILGFSEVLVISSAVEPDSVTVSVVTSCIVVLTVLSVLGNAVVGLFVVPVAVETGDVGLTGPSTVVPVSGIAVVANFVVPDSTEEV